MEHSAINIKVGLALLARVDACAREAGVSRPEFVRAAMAAACDRAEAGAARRARLAKRTAEGAD